MITKILNKIVHNKKSKFKKDTTNDIKNIQETETEMIFECVNNEEETIPKKLLTKKLIFINNKHFRESFREEPTLIESDDIYVIINKDGEYIRESSDGKTKNGIALFFDKEYHSKVKEVVEQFKKEYEITKEYAITCYGDYIGLHKGKNLVEMKKMA